MSALTDARRANPWRLDQIINYSGAAYRRSARCNKHVALAHGIHESRGSRYRTGDPNAPLTKALLALAECHCTSAWPALVEAFALVEQVEIEGASDDALAARRVELETVEHDLERDENRATYSRDDDACIEAHAAKAAVHLELMALVREQVERKRRRA